MTKAIRYPSDEWIDTYCEKHACTMEDAETAWWDKEIDAGRPTPYDLPEDKAKEVKKIIKNAKSEKAVDAYGRERKRERKADNDKRFMIDCLRVLLEGMQSNGQINNVTVTNIEKSIDYTINGECFTINLVKHRPPKKEG
jgi:hypothetical protein